MGRHKTLTLRREAMFQHQNEKAVISLMSHREKGRQTVPLLLNLT